MQVNKLARAGGGFEVVWRRADIFLPYTTQSLVETMVPQRHTVSILAARWCVGLCRAGFSY